MSRMLFAAKHLFVGSCRPRGGLSTSEKEEKVYRLIIGLTTPKGIKFTTCELLATLFSEKKKIRTDFGGEPFVKRQ